MGQSTVKETKKEHYVPQCYLERWKNSKGYVAVYDKKLKMSRGNNIKDIACERYYYDIDYRELSAQKLALLRELGIEPTKDDVVRQIKIIFHRQIILSCFKGFA